MDDVMERLSRELTLSENGDVTNAVGAITSKVSISRNARVAAISNPLRKRMNAPLRR